MRSCIPVVGVRLIPGGRADEGCCSKNLERFPDLVVEGCGGHLVLFRPRKILEPAAFPRFQDEMRTLARLFPGEMQIPEKFLDLD